jgi:hemerythrin-like domain-containing protein
VPKAETTPKDAIAVLKHDHQAIERLFKEFERTGEKEQRKKKKLVKQIVQELSGHAQIEEQVFYPEVQSAVEANELALEAMEEHDLVKVLLQQLETMTPEEERFQSKATVLMELVRRHVKKEERDMFPAIRKALTAAQLKDLGTRLVEGKKAMQSPRDYLSMN